MCAALEESAEYSSLVSVLQLVIHEFLKQESAEHDVIGVFSARI